ncbi:hypothetical protein [Aeromonas enteropelogenes]|uniref:hypothetical protein n=1 Tax=Aeromonas enteropelogenes TaxID=29489 RepID=UPI003BA089E2
MNKVLGGLAAVAVTGDENDVNTGADRAETVYRYGRNLGPESGTPTFLTGI